MNCLTEENVKQALVSSMPDRYNQIVISDNGEGDEPRQFSIWLMDSAYDNAKISDYKEFMRNLIALMDEDSLADMHCRCCHAAKFNVFDPFSKLNLETEIMKYLQKNIDEHVISLGWKAIQERDGTLIN